MTQRITLKEKGFREWLEGLFWAQDVSLAQYFYHSGAHEPAQIPKWARPFDGSPVLTARQALAVLDDR